MSSWHVFCSILEIFQVICVLRLVLESDVGAGNDTGQPVMVAGRAREARQSWLACSCGGKGCAQLSWVTVGTDLEISGPKSATQLRTP